MGRSFDFQDQGHSKDLKYAYEIMGLGEEASQEEVRKRYLELMKIHHSDKGGNDGKASIINEAYEILSRTPQSNDQRTPVSNREKRKGSPVSKVEFNKWLEEDIDKYPSNLTFQSIKCSNTVKENLWKLIEAKQLSYEDLENEALQKPLSISEQADGLPTLLWKALCYVIFNDNSVTEYLCAEPNKTRIAKLAEMHSFRCLDEGKYVNLLSKLADVVYENNSPTCNHPKLFLFLILTNVKGVGLLSLNALDSTLVNSSYVCAKECGLEKFGCESMMKLVDDYYEKKLNFNQLLRQLKYIDFLIFSNNCELMQKLLDGINEDYLEPINNKIAELKQRKNKESGEDKESEERKEKLRIKISQLKEARKEIRHTVEEEITTWVKAYENKVKSEPDIPCTSGEVFSLRCKALNLCEKVDSLVKDYENRKEICNNVNEWGVFFNRLRSVAKLLGSLLTLICSYRVRIGFWSAHADTHFMLRDCRKNNAKRIASDKDFNSEAPPLRIR
ncbi:CBU_0062 family Dot/Icm type IV secretion system effector [Coxiella burnetii]|uniref:DnaJ domain protein n=1 Tax=Coxiella burnetii (strain RSA 493 / Nine Mile phase I) TaxID=227377 RepID=Q83F86_COXBU|nr:CBU_0062 family Dot/Icm type IV secretion system effector [Coxiella burnetii]NP_819115.1 DnaJ domain-containing protein [Coxiella burnetii RSA 493]AAO89629.1 DnaJ domain protein [Coxiella burnetii RSA 493]ARI64986.1 molecular chaperone DnaJ [Coxiella burnetii]ARK26491.1 molecular chaperone DnaJ [Coxiella burnetii]MCF2093115.1 CBU_0062 family Dot/Icm type IV secretion system effector [Coxiella burnetii]MCF2095207.1 CBU_0062 family Dot/Icm type IV secretion system effector [Coxiella burnetii